MVFMVLMVFMEQVTPELVTPEQVTILSHLLSKHQ